jgi:putative aldouronate transport system permease protein
MDGASRIQQIVNITIPGILPTITILLILQIGGMLSVGFEKVYLLYNPAIYEKADVISTYVYRKGLEELSYSYSSAVGLFNSVVNFMLLYVANFFSRKFSESSLW